MNPTAAAILELCFALGVEGRNVSEIVVVPGWLAAEVVVRDERDRPMRCIEDGYFLTESVCLGWAP